MGLVKHSAVDYFVQATTTRLKRHPEDFLCLAKEELSKLMLGHVLRRFPIGMVRVGPSAVILHLKHIPIDWWFHGLPNKSQWLIQLNHVGASPKGGEH